MCHSIGKQLIDCLASLWLIGVRMFGGVVLMCTIRTKPVISDAARASKMLRGVGLPQASAGGSPLSL